MPRNTVKFNKDKVHANVVSSSFSWTLFLTFNHLIYL